MPNRARKQRMKKAKELAAASAPGPSTSPSEGIPAPNEDMEIKDKSKDKGKGREIIEEQVGIQVDGQDGNQFGGTGEGEEEEVEGTGEGEEEAAEPDIEASGAVTIDLTKEVTVSWKCLPRLYGQEWFTQDLVPQADDAPSCGLIFRLPDHERASIGIRIELPRDMSPEVNPAQLTSHIVQLTIPAFKVSDFRYADLPDGTILADDHEFFAKGDGFTYPNGNLAPLAIGTIQTLGVYVSGAVIPPLAMPGLHQRVTDFVQGILDTTRLERSVDLQFRLRRREDITNLLASRFYERMRHDAAVDPALAWINNSPTAEAFTMGNLVGPLDRPDIPVQRADTVFTDRKAYLIAQLYGNMYEEEYQELCINELRAEEFPMKLLESPIAVNPEDALNDTDVNVITTARAYFAFVNFNEKDVARPEVGDSVKVTIIAEPAQANEDGEQENPEEEVGDPNAEEEQRPVTPSIPEDQRSHTSDNGSFEAGLEDDTDEVELGNEDLIDVFDEDAANEDQDPLTWHATVVEPTEITPPGHITLLLERRRDPTFKGSRNMRPFVTHPLQAANFRAATTTERLAQALINSPSTKIRLTAKYSKQGFKDQVRCNDDLWRSTLPQAQRICETLLCHNAERPPLQRVNLHNLKGESKLDVTERFNTAQKDIYESWANAREIEILHGPFGTGKTTILLSLATEVMSNPIRTQVLYTVESNKAVDDVALRLEALCTEYGLRKSIIRAYSLKGEKSQVYKYFDDQLGPQTRYAISDTFVTEFATVAYLAELNKSTQAIRDRGDPRRTLQDMSLSAAMYRTLEGSWHPNDRLLRANLKEYGQDGFHNTSPEQRLAIKLALNDLMAIPSRAQTRSCAHLQQQSKSI